MSYYNRREVQDSLPIMADYRKKIKNNRVRGTYPSSYSVSSAVGGAMWAGSNEGLNFSAAENCQLSLFRPVLSDSFCTF